MNKDLTIMLILERRLRMGLSIFFGYCIVTCHHGFGFWFLVQLLHYWEMTGLQQHRNLEARSCAGSPAILGHSWLFSWRKYFAVHTQYFLTIQKFCSSKYFCPGGAHSTAVSRESFNCESSQPVIVLSNSFSIMCNFSVQLFHISG